ncbi:MAG TPA: GTP-binding protein [Phycisphaerae bacterium]|nr:GTP-binding protein [Phycisphaerae bacterium]
MSKEHLKFVVVGSVDHGKSTLIGRFLYDTGSLSEAQMDTIRKLCGDNDEAVEFAYVLDHLEEERTKHVTIDTTQTFFSSESRDYVIIDAPGHKEFLKNMITGASQASAALLLLDVDEGVRQQTRRHAYMVRLLGIKQLVVVLNKMDRVDFRQDAFDRAAADMTELLGRVTLDQLAVIPVAALAGENVVRRSEEMPWYDGPTVIEALDLLHADVADESLPLRLPVQDVYEIDGEKVAVGKVASGKISAGQTVRLAPGGQEVKVAGLRKFEGPIASASAGESIGFTVSGNGRLTRGQTLCSADDVPAQDTSVTAHVFWMSPQSLRKGERIALRLATQEIPCVAERIANRMNAGTLAILDADADELANTEVAEVTLTADEPIQHESFTRIAEMGRLVLMRGPDIVAGGILT